MSAVGEVVFDYIASISPYYSAEELYINENDAIYLPGFFNNNE
jgi:hypothetical protein